MGEQLIGCLIVGPREITDSMLSKAATAILHLLEDETSIECDNCGEPILKRKRTQEELDMHACTVGAEMESNFVCWKQLLPVDRLQAVLRYLKELLSIWPDGATDINCRLLPGNMQRMIVFAGEMSYGDAPEGAGFRMIEMIYNLGPEVMEALEIE
jgi:hypothetical protein